LNGTFMQDAQVTGPVRAIGELHPLAPSGATKAWWHKNTPASLGPPDAARHLIAAWFCSTAAAGRSAGEYLDEPGVTYRPRGNPAAAISAVRAFGVGDTLLRSLLSRIQREWLGGAPLWAAPHGAAPGRDGLTDATWTGDAFRLVADGEVYTGFMRAGRRAEGDPKLLERALWQADPHILRRQLKADATGAPVRVSLQNLPAGAAALEYVGELFCATSKVEAVNPLSGLIVPRRFIYHLHRVEGSRMAPEITQSAFLGLDEHLLGPDARGALTQLAQKVAGPVRAALWAAASTALERPHASTLLTAAYREFAHSAEDLLAEAMEEGLPSEQTITRYLEIAEQAFRTASSPYRTPARAAASAKADGMLRALLNRAAPRPAVAQDAASRARRELASWALAVREADPGRAAELARLALPQPPLAVDAGLRARLRRLDPVEHEGALRAVGVTVALRKVPHSSRRVGEALAALPGSLTELLTVLLGADLTVAVRVLVQQLARTTGVSYFDLAETLCLWDAGDPVARRRHRERLLTDYLSPRPQRSSR
ncbi:MAG TPA: hypothetical protein VL242_35175, partial [Sorangium sp.]|nr:hypothetical protein [Sorangium sp.]